MTDVEKASQEKMEKTFVSGGSNTPEGTVVTRVVSQDGEGVVVPQHQHEFSLLSAVGLAFAILNVCVFILALFVRFPRRNDVLSCCLLSSHGLLWPQAYHWPYHLVVPHLSFGV